MIEERTGEAFEFDEKLTVVGGKLQPGDAAPEFELDYFDPENEEMETVRLSDSAGGVPAQRRQLAGYAGLPRRNAPV